MKIAQLSMLAGMVWLLASPVMAADTTNAATAAQVKTASAPAAKKVHSGLRGKKHRKACAGKSCK